MENDKNPTATKNQKRPFSARNSSGPPLSNMTRTLTDRSVERLPSTRSSRINETPAEPPYNKAASVYPSQSKPLGSDWSDGRQEVEITGISDFRDVAPAPFKIRKRPAPENGNASSLEDRRQNQAHLYDISDRYRQDDYPRAQRPSPPEYYQSSKRVKTSGTYNGRGDVSYKRSPEPSQSLSMAINSNERDRRRKSTDSYRPSDSKVDRFHPRSPNPIDLYRPGDSKPNRPRPKSSSAGNSKAHNRRRGSTDTYRPASLEFSPPRPKPSSRSSAGDSRRQSTHQDVRLNQRLSPPKGSTSTGSNGRGSALSTSRRDNPNLKLNVATTKPSKTPNKVPSSTSQETLRSRLPKMGAPYSKLSNAASDVQRDFEQDVSRNLPGQLMAHERSSANTSTILPEGDGSIPGPDSFDLSASTSSVSQTNQSLESIPAGVSALTATTTAPREDVTPAQADALDRNSTQGPGSKVHREWIQIRLHVKKCTRCNNTSLTVQQRCAACDVQFCHYCIDEGVVERSADHGEPVGGWDWTARERVTNALKRDADMMGGSIRKGPAKKGLLVQDDDENVGDMEENVRSTTSAHPTDGPSTLAPDSGSASLNLGSIETLGDAVAYINNLTYIPTDDSDDQHYDRLRSQCWNYDATLERVRNQEGDGMAEAILDTALLIMKMILIGQKAQEN